MLCSFMNLKLFEQLCHWLLLTLCINAQVASLFFPSSVSDFTMKMNERFMLFSRYLIPNSCHFHDFHAIKHPVYNQISIGLPYARIMRQSKWTPFFKFQDWNLLKSRHKFLFHKNLHELKPWTCQRNRTLYTVFDIYSSTVYNEIIPSQAKFIN